MTRKEILNFGKEIVHKIFHIREDSITLKGYTARDKNGKLFFYEVKPTKTIDNVLQEYYWVASVEGYQLPRILYPFVKWEDEEPTKTEMYIKLTNHG